MRLGELGRISKFGSRYLLVCSIKELNYLGGRGVRIVGWVNPLVIGFAGRGRGPWLAPLVGGPWYRKRPKGSDGAQFVFGCADFPTPAPPKNMYDHLFSYVFFVFAGNRFGVLWVPM